MRPVAISSEIQKLRTAPTGKREQTKAANRDSILEAARMVFAELGYDSTTVRDIIRRTDLASGTFYNYFRSKEEIFEALARDSVVEFGKLLKGVRQSAVTFEDYLRSAYGAYFRFLIGQRDDMIKLGAPQTEMIGVRVDTPEMHAVFDEIRKDIEIVLDRNGSLEVDTEYLTAAAVGIARELGNVMLKRLSVSGQSRLEETIEFATSMTLTGVHHLFD
jgi:AcrR family transcriptional regulator